MKRKYNGYWIEEISFNIADLFMIYPIGTKRPNEYKAVKTLSIRDAKIYIDSLGDNLGDTESTTGGQNG